MDENLPEYFLKPTFFMDSDNDIIKKFVDENTEESMSLKEKSVALFYSVRDKVFYSPYNIDFTKNGMKASTIITKGLGYCVAKSVALCAVLKCAGIPSRLRLADVKNHLTPENLKEVIGTDMFYYHGYSELFLNGKWIKATPTFNKELCKEFGLKSLEFDGENDCRLHEFDTKGRKHMTYIKDYGYFEELPFDEIKTKSLKLYKGLFTKTD